MSLRQLPALLLAFTFSTAQADILANETTRMREEVARARAEKLDESVTKWRSEFNKLSPADKGKFIDQVLLGISPLEMRLAEDLKKVAVANVVDAKDVRLQVPTQLFEAAAGALAVALLAGKAADFSERFRNYSREYRGSLRNEVPRMLSMVAIGGFLLTFVHLGLAVQSYEVRLETVLTVDEAKQIVTAIRENRRQLEILKAKQAALEVQ